MKLRIRWPSVASLQMSTWRVWEGYLALPSCPFPSTRPEKLPCWDRLLHAGGRVSPGGKKGEAHESSLLSGVSKAGGYGVCQLWEEVLRRYTLSSSMGVKKTWAASRSKGLAVFSHPCDSGLITFHPICRPLPGLFGLAA